MMLKLILTLVALTLAGCSPRQNAQDEQEVGTVGLPLAVEASGVTYRVLGDIVIRRKRDGSVAATIEAGPGSPNTEAVKLVPGAYTIEMADGYACTVAPAEASFRGCTFTGATPERFVITAGRTTAVALRFMFHFDDDVEVILRKGTANIVLASEEDRPCGAEGCPSGTTCAAVDGAAPACAEQCATNDDCPTDKACFTVDDESIGLCAAVVTEIWTRQFGTSENDEAASVSADSDGNVLVGGNTNGALLGKASLGRTDGFVLKFDPDGNVLWAHQVGSSTDDYVYSVAAGGDGGTLVAGATGSELPGQSGLGASDAFVQKLDTDGNVLWTKQFGTNNYDAAYSVDVDTDGSVLLAGVISGSTLDAFVKKLDAEGNVLWHKALDTGLYDEATSVRANGDGSLFVAGKTSGTFQQQTYLGGFYDAYLQKVDAEGTTLWTRHLGTSAGDYALSVSTSIDGGVFVAGYTDGAFPGQSDFGGLDAFLQRLDADGELSWVQQFGGAGDDRLHSVATDDGGNVIVSGFGSGELAGGFARKFDPEGQHLWTSLLAQVSRAQGVTVDDDANVVLVGWVSAALDGQTYLGGLRDAFVKKLGP
jgi:hypothetical protein